MADPIVKKRRYGWKRDLSDHRDHLFQVPHSVQVALPKHVDLSPKCPPLVDQLELGACTANAICLMHRFDQKKQGDKAHFMPSRLFVYYNERAIEHTTKSDAGAELRDGIKTIAKQGVCRESTWPYDVDRFADRPSPEAYAEAKDHQAIKYQKVIQLLDQLKGCLAAGYPFVFGFTVYESFESTSMEKTGIMPLPGKAEMPLGGHAVMAVGYDDSTRRFKIANSWSTAWGQHGFFTMPYEFIEDPSYCSDFWQLERVEVNGK